MKTELLVEQGRYAFGIRTALLKTTGEAMLPILNSLGYDLSFLGNWEVLKYKKRCSNFWAR